jgi:SHS2 domain-containing protein
MGRFELFEHTADIGVRAYGKSLNEAFAYAAMGMFEVVTNVDSIKPVGEVQIILEGSDIEDLLTRWLSELLFLLDMKKMLMAEFDVTIDESKISLKAKARGEIYAPERHEYKTEIKAVTQHMLEIKQVDDNPDEKYMVQVLLDI